MSLPEPYYTDGRATIYHGDCLSVLRGLKDKTVDSIVTDPPFKLSQAYSANVDSDNVIGVSSIWPAALEMLRVARPGALAAVFYDMRILPLALEAFRWAGWKYLRGLTFYRRWGNAHKLHGWMSTSDFILIFTKPGDQPQFFGPYRHDVYTKSQPELFDAGHPAQKPIEAMRHLIQNITPLGGMTLDPYMGSGSSIVAAMQGGFKSIGVDRSEEYCSIAAARLAQEVLPLDA